MRSLNSYSGTGLSYLRMRIGYQSLDKTMSTSIDHSDPASP
nr:MAG TPA: hypothetical protein [Myoviridae sp. ctTS62]